MVPPMTKESFDYDFRIGYLRHLQNDKSPITGQFTTEGYDIIWGAVAEYGDPPVGGLLIEMWGETNEEKGESATFRFWYAKESHKGRKVRAATVMYDDLDGGPAADRSNT